MGVGGPAEPELGVLRRRVAANPVWYHAIELAPGLVTPGLIDHRDLVGSVLPVDMEGMRALDIGTFDGFWAFEMERRGAEVVAIDVDQIDGAQWPPVNRQRLEREAEEWGVNLGQGFEIAHSALGSGVDRRICEVGELDAERIGGRVDFAFAGAIMLHLRDPVGALERIRECLEPDGELRQLEPFSRWLSLVSRRRPAARFQPLETSFNWWVPNLAGLIALPRAAGFVEVERIATMTPRAESKDMRQRYACIASRPGS